MGACGVSVLLGRSVVIHSRYVCPLVFGSRYGFSGQSFMTASFPKENSRSSSQVFFFGLCAAALHHGVAWRLPPALRPLPCSVAAACVFFFLLRHCLQSRRAGLCQGGGPWGALGGAPAPRPCRSPGGITFRASQGEEKRRSNRQGAWRKSLPSG